MSVVVVHADHDGVRGGFLPPRTRLEEGQADQALEDGRRFVVDAGHGWHRSGPGEIVAFPSTVRLGPAGEVVSWEAAKT